jgi:hypothetical protein
MRPAAVALLRRLAVVSLTAAAILLGGPWVLRELGFLGPSVDQEIRSAEVARSAAAVYGASEATPAFRDAGEALEEARRLAEAGELRAARIAARTALQRSIEAQRRVLAAREESRRLAEKVVLDVSERLDELEALHSSVSPRLGESEQAELLSLMKNARRVGSRLSLAYEEGAFQRVLAGQREVVGALETARATLWELRARQEQSTVG